MYIEPIGTIQCGFEEKFGLPRQSGLGKSIRGRLIFEEKYRDANAVKGLEQFSHLWLLWEFAPTGRKEFSPTVRPPRLGGNERMGVFATRSPHRPNRLGLSCVKLEKIDFDCPQGPQLLLSGLDMRSGTPVYDIKPYIAYADAHPDAVSGYADAPPERVFSVCFSEEAQKQFSPPQQEELREALSFDPRPSYKTEDGQTYGFTYAGKNVRFCIENKTLHILSAEPRAMYEKGDLHE